MKTAKIVVIGAGSASFGLANLGAVLRTPELRGSELCLVDVDGEKLRLISSLARRMNEEWSSDFSISSGTERKDYLTDADFLIMSLAINRDECWRTDQRLARKYGIMHYGENGGPGALMHTARNLAVIMPILRDMQEMCPDAWLLNFTNPVPRICLAAARHMKIKTIGICHQINFGYLIVGNVLSRELDIPAPGGYLFTWEDAFGENHAARISAAASEKIEIRAAGLNHFTWMLAIRDRSSGEDLYPIFRRRLEDHFDRFEPLSREVHETFGLFPVPGDCHLCEYLPYTHNMDRKAWDRYDIQDYSFEKSAAHAAKQWSSIESMAAGRESISPMLEGKTERAEIILAGIMNDSHSHECAVNIPNERYIPNLPERAIVEVPAVICAEGARGESVGPLPEPIAELCRRQIAVADLAVEASIAGDRRIALQALALDPMIDDLRVAGRLLSDYLSAFSVFLPQFSR